MIANPYSKLTTIKQYAIDHRVPIMKDEGIDYLTNYISENQITRILEIGTAIGYSAIMMALSNPNVHVTSVERNREMYLEAVKNIKDMDLENQITLIFKDALELDLKEEKYELIFIDAAKAQSQKFFERFEHNLTKDGTIITDNISFHGLVEQEEKEIPSRNLRGLVRKIKAYIEFLKNHSSYDTEFLKIGDGLSVSRRKV